MQDKAPQKLGPQPSTQERVSILFYASHERTISKPYSEGALDKVRETLEKTLDPKLITQNEITLKTFEFESVLAPLTAKSIFSTAKPSLDAINSRTEHEFTEDRLQRVVEVMKLISRNIMEQ